QKIKRVLEFVWKNPYSSFYRDTYIKAGVDPLKDVSSLDDFRKLPLLTREEIVKSDPLARIFLPQMEIHWATVSSGTTGDEKPLAIFKSKLDASLKRYTFGKPNELGIKMMLLLYSVFSGQARLLGDNTLGHVGFTRVLGDINNLSLSAKVAARIKIDSIQTTPTILYFFIPFLKQEYNLEEIKYIYLAGEFCSEQKLQFFKSVFKKAYFKFSYGSIEAEVLGFRCNVLNDLPSRFFHPLPIFYYEEVVNSEGNNSLVISHLSNKIAFPLIRYETKDAIKMVDSKCDCGQEVLMEVFGKLEYDTAKIQGTVIYSSQVYQALEPFKRYLASIEWQMHIFEEVRGEKILPKLKIQLVPIKEKQEKLKQIRSVLEQGIVEKLYLSSKMTLAELVKKGVFLPLEVEFVENLSFSTKQKHIISHLG
ncbi:hypothetical protein M1307_04000, partial [Patescibacteria group bacterium]|nr:hypothetical protein [Patescibacteria group bacterium]